jgi:hypothetical protein
VRGRERAEESSCGEDKGWVDNDVWMGIWWARCAFQNYPRRNTISGVPVSFAPYDFL